jgi:hypothetical protein
MFENAKKRMRGLCLDAPQSIRLERGFTGRERGMNPQIPGFAFRSYLFQSATSARPEEHEIAIDPNALIERALGRKSGKLGKRSDGVGLFRA